MSSQMNTAYQMRKTSNKVCDQNRDGTRIIQIGDWLYSFGGWTSDIPIDSEIKTPVSITYNDIYRSSGDLGVWEKVGEAEWPGRHTFGLDWLGIRIYVYGSDTQNPVMDMWITYDGIQWFKESNMPMINRVLYGSCSDGCYIYLIGGMDDIKNFRSKAYSVWRFDGNNWWFIGSGLAAFEKNLSGAACYFNRKLWVISGGTYGTYTGTQEVYSSSDKGATWERENDIPFPGRQYHNTCVWDNKLWLIGGVGGEKKANLNDIWYMDEQGNWTEFWLPEEFLPRHASGVAVFNNKLVITNGNYHNDCWVIEKIN